MSVGRTFVDSNVFIYAVQITEPDKAERCTQWLRFLFERGVGFANLQVLNEVTNVLIKRRKMTAAEVFTVIDGYRVFGITPVSLETIAGARLIHFEMGYSWWDCVLIASAIELRCTHFLSEDIKAEHKVRGLTIISPFQHSPHDLSFH